MAKKNDDFFKEKKPWSEVKDDLLGCYFKPYVSKILHTYKPLVYVDCFAGKGKFEDGNPGSPLIALDIINECTCITTVDTVNINAIFIDLNYAADLIENLKGYSNTHIISGKYEDNILNILKDKAGSNIFLYIDPYGIKALQHSLFDGFARGSFNSIELLINMNSFGFIREACHAVGSTFDDKALFDDLVEYSSTTLDASEKSIQELNEIAGGDYWKQIIDSYKSGKIDGYEAESEFSEQYCKRLMDSFKYVLNMPLRIKKGQRPKYRLIHATNHRDGCLLMVDNICNRWEALKDIQTGGQLQMWAEDFNNQIVDDEDVVRKISEHFSKYDQWISLNDAMTVFFMRHGPICSTKAVRDAIKNHVKTGRMEVLRIPESKNGKPTKFYTEGKGQVVSVRWLR